MGKAFDNGERPDQCGRQREFDQHYGVGPAEVDGLLQPPQEDQQRQGQQCRAGQVEATACTAALGEHRRGGQDCSNREDGQRCRRDERRPKPLEGAGGEQQLLCLGEAGGEGGRAEDRKANLQHPPSAVGVSEP